MTTIQQESVAQSVGLPPLLIEALRVAQTVQMGVHGRRRVGGGDSFWQFRNYEGTDAASMIDWRQSARGDTLYVRQREWEAVQTVYLWTDSSGSMHYKSRDALPLKTERAHVLMLALAHLLLRGGERTVWLRPEPIVTKSPSGFNMLAAHVLPPPHDTHSLPPPIAFIAHAHMVLCGDFLADPEMWRKRLQGYAALNMRGALLHIADPEEASPSFQGRVKVSGLESEPSLVLPQAQAVHGAYRERFAAHKTMLQDMAQGIGWSFHHHVTDRPVAPTLLNIIQTLTTRR